jgi:hypothetical protein
VRATAGRVGALAPVFGRAFVEEPMTLWSLGEHGDAEARLTSAFACFLEQVLGLGLVWETAGGRGAAVWVPPDRLEGWAVHPWSHPQTLVLPKRDLRDNRIQPHTRTWPSQQGAPRAGLVCPGNPPAAGRAPAWRGAWTASAASARDDQALRQAALLRASNEILCSQRPEVGEDLLAEEPNLLSQFG